MKHFIALLIIVSSLFTILGCSNSNASSPGKENQDAPKDPTVKVLSSTVVSVYNKDCGCDDGSYKNIITKTVVGNDTFVTFQRKKSEGGITILKVSE